MKQKTITLCGLAAVNARWETDPGSFVRLFFDRATGRKVSRISKALSAARKVFRCVEEDELQRVAGSVHHGGIVAVVAAPRWDAPGRRDPEAWAAAKETVLVLDRVGNAHNLGALARSAAFHGIRHLVIPDSPEAARPNDAAYRVAEGGLEYVQIWIPGDLLAFIRELVRVGYEVVGAATRGGRDGFEDLKTGAPVAIVLGNEEKGISPAVEHACTRLVTLRGSGHVESLNVSVAGAILMDRICRLSRGGET